MTAASASIDRDPILVLTKRVEEPASCSFSPGIDRQGRARGDHTQRNPI
jgi:hypothetical protein